MHKHPDLHQHAIKPRHAFTGLVFALVIFSVLLGSSAGWMRYTKKRTTGLQDGAYQTMGAMLPEMSPVGGLTPVGATSRFICPQCSGYCWTPTRAGSLLCPFCKQQMVQEAPGVVAAAGVAVDGLTPVAATTTSIIPVQAGVKAAHVNRGACTNCHTVIRTANQALAPAIQAGLASTHRNRGACTACHSVVKVNGGGLVPTITADAVAIHPNRGACANCHLVTNLKAAALNAAALTPVAAATASPGTTGAPPISAGAAAPLLLKPLGMEVCTVAGEGAKVTGVMGNSNASRAGIVAGDIIVELNGKKVADADGLMKLVTAAPPEANAQLKVMRNGRLQKAAVMVGEGEMEGFTPIPVKK